MRVIAHSHLWREHISGCVHPDTSSCTAVVKSPRRELRQRNQPAVFILTAPAAYHKINLLYVAESREAMRHLLHEDAHMRIDVGSGHGF